MPTREKNLITPKKILGKLCRGETEKATEYCQRIVGGAAKRLTVPFTGAKKKSPASGETYLRAQHPGQALYYVQRIQI